MNAKILSNSKFNLFEKKCLASRLAIFLIVLVILGEIIFGNSSASTVFTLLGIVLLFVTQFLYQFRILNLMLGCVLFAGGCYFFLATLSEFSEFEVIVSRAYSLLIVGGGGSLLAIVLSVFIFRNLAKQII